MALVELIDRYNTMLISVVRDNGFKDHVYYVDLTPTLSNDKDCKDDWTNELHPSRDRDQGFFKVAEKFADVLSKLP